MDHYDISGILPGVETGSAGPMPPLRPAPVLPAKGDDSPAIDDTIVITPGMAGAFYDAGIARRHLKDFRGAARDFELALRLDPTHVGAKFELKSLRVEA